MENTARNFALQLGSLISLYISITALITLLFGIITVQYPDAAQAYWEYESAAGSIRFSIAMLIVFFPVYIVLTRMVNTIRRTEQGTYLTLTKWLIYLSLLVGGAVILGDLVAVIYGFLNGELTVRFILKALVFLLVVGAAFVYYLFDARGYWHTREKQSIRYAGGVALIVIISIVFGFLSINTPSEVREMQIDDRQIRDLSNIQSHIDAYFYQNESLPESISEAFSGIAIPEAPEERAPYTYSITGEGTYELCAEFAFESTPNSRPEFMYYDSVRGGGVMTWEHGAGEWCFKGIAPQIDEPLR